jgi:SRSO17 transposase
MKTIIETTPKVNLTVKDIEDLPTELAHYAVIYQDLFGRREQKEHYQTYLEGLMLDMPNKSVETMMLTLKGDDPNSIRNMQHFVSEGSWRRLYLPQEWIEDAAYAERRRKCGVPEEITFKTKPALLLEMVKEVHADGHPPFRWLACDEAFGRDTAFLDQVGDYLWYFVEVEKDTRAWSERPQTAIPDWSGRGRKPTRARLVAGEPGAQEVHMIAASLPADAWTCHTIKEGSKGTLVADFAALRVVTVRDSLPGPEVWLVLRRNPANGEVKYYLSNAPAETELATFAWISGMRWPIETCFEEGKQELGLGDYQVRSWTGWHHHMTLCILAHFFLVRLQIRLKDKVPNLTLPQAILLLKATLEQPQLDAHKAIEIVDYYQRRHHAAYRSHRKRRSSNKD